MGTTAVIILDKALIIQYMEVSGTSSQKRDMMQNCNSVIITKHYGQLVPYPQQFSNEDHLSFLRYSY